MFLLLSIVVLAAWTILRIFLIFDSLHAGLNVLEIVGILFVGFCFDLATLSYLSLPAVLLSFLQPKQITQSSFFNQLRWILCGGFIFLLLLLCISEYLFWQEFNTRFNFIAVDYLIYRNEVIGNINQSYPVKLILLCLVIITAFILFLLQKIYRLNNNIINIKQKGIRLIFSVFCVFIVWNTLSIDLLNRLFRNSYSQELAVNGLYGFFSAVHNNELDYEQFYLTIPHNKAIHILNQLKQGRNPNHSSVTTSGNVLLKKPKNVVLISVESLSASYLGAYGNTKGLTPNLDHLAGEGLVFQHMYATGTRTVRGLEALSLGLPPIPGQSIVRRPHNHHLSTVGEYLEQQGVKTAFIYGGYGYFDNMNDYFSGNDYQVFDRTQFTVEKELKGNIWGVADEALFENSIRYINTVSKQSKPFFMHIMTTSNHRPYTFPKGRVDMPQGERESAVKYTDYAIGRFMRLAKSQTWFDETLFIIIADHCASVAGKTKLPIEKYHIPLIFYGPKIIASGKVDKLVSQLDLPPTILHLLDYQGENQFFGENLFTHSSLARAFISNYQSLGYFKQGKLLVLLPKKKVEMYSIDPFSYEATKTNVDKDLMNEAIAYYQLAAFDFKHGLLNEVQLNHAKAINAE